MTAFSFICVAVAFIASATCKNIPTTTMDHYRVVAVTDNLGFVTANMNGGKDKPFTGAYIDILDAVATAGNFTYTIMAQPDGQYGKKVANSKWNGMIGSILAGTADIAVGNWAETPERAAVVDFATVLEDFPAFILFNPRSGTDGAQYLTREGIELYLLKKSADPRAKSVYANIKAHNKTAIVRTIEDAAKQVSMGKFAFIGDEDSVDAMVDAFNGTIMKDPTPIDTGVPLAAFAAKKGSKVGMVLSAVMDIVMQTIENDAMFVQVSSNSA